MSRAKGNEAESKAVSFLHENNYTVIERNFYSKFGEIDIIASKEGVYHFVEVKSGKGFEPIYAITPSKLNKIIKTANFYILLKQITAPFVIDAIVIKGDSIELIDNITL